MTPAVGDGGVFAEAGVGKYGVPEYTEPLDYEVDGEWVYKEESTKVIETEKGDITIDIRFMNRHPFVVMEGRPDGFEDGEILWTIVHYARDYGIPGVAKERIFCNGQTYRLGALYCIGVEEGVFEFTERETDYLTYGERPYEPGDGQ